MSAEHRILERLAFVEGHGKTWAGFWAPDDQAEIRRMEARGLVIVREGDGKDEGALLARRKAVAPESPAETGGDVA